MCNTLGLHCMQGPGSSICNLHQLWLQFPGTQCMAALTNPFDKLVQFSVSLGKCICTQSIKQTHLTSGNNDMIDVSTSDLVMPAKSISMQGSILVVLLLHLVIADIKVLCKAFCVVVNHLTMHTFSQAALLPLSQGQLPGSRTHRTNCDCFLA